MKCFNEVVSDRINRIDRIVSGYPEDSRKKLGRCAAGTLSDAIRAAGAGFFSFPIQNRIL